MAVKEIGGRWFPLKANGKPYKQGHASKAQAEAALAKAQAYWASRAGPPSAPSTSPEPDDLDNDPDTSHDRQVLGIPPKVTPDEDTEGW